MSIENTQHVSRAYQEELFQVARRQNVIAALGTGSGKTLIAAMLIKAVSVLPESTDKKIFFLVPKVPLVAQQKAFLETQTPLRIRGYTGKMNVDSWDKVTWMNEFASADVLVMTPQIFSDLLTHAFYSIDKTSLIIFDECHHARKLHPYNTIMSVHYSQCSLEGRPKIFGMTASPVWNIKDPAGSVRVLQHNLFARIYAVRDNFEELLRYSPKPTEVVWHFASSPSAYAEYPHSMLWNDLETGSLWPATGLSKEDVASRYNSTLAGLGPLGAEFFLHAVLSTKVAAISAAASGVAFTLLLTNHVNAVSEEELESSAKPASLEDLDRLQYLLSLVHTRLMVAELPSAWISPKCLALFEVLKARKGTSFQAVVFVEQRQTAVALSWLLGRAAETKDWIKCSELTGHGEVRGSVGVFSGMGLKPQDGVVRAFRNGELNLIIATSVAEEGLDFPACDLVIRFDPAKNMVSYLQSRGRARRKDSTLLVMIDEENEEELSRYQKLRDAELALRSFYQLLYADKPNDEEYEELDEERDDVRDLAEREIYVIPSTNATLTYHSAIQLLNDLCSLIRRDKYSPPHQPNYVGTFQVRLELPSALPLPKDKLIIDGPLKRSKKEAKRASAFIAVRMLHELGVFDDHLSYSQPRKGDGVLDADGTLISKVSDVPVEMDVPVKTPWMRGPPWFIHVVSIDGRPCAGIIHGRLFEKLDLVVQGQQILLEPSSSICLDLDEVQVRLINEYTQMGLWWCVTATPITSTMACFLVPLDASFCPNWDEMRVACADSKGSYDWSGVTDKDGRKLIIMNGRRYGHPLLFHRFRDDLCLHDKSDVSDQEGNVLSYADLFAHQYRSTIIPVATRIIEVSKLLRKPSSSYGLVQQSERPIDRCDTFLLPQWFCRRAALTEGVIDALRVFSPLCQRIIDIYRARLAIRDLHLPKILDNYMIEALTIPSAQAGFNNQRLETLGDSVLKLAVVTYVFNHFPRKHEGQLTQLKGTSVSNRCLLSRGKQRGLETYITSECLSARSWLFTIDNDVANDRTVQRLIPRRSMQDCMEAILGASYVTGDIDMALQAGDALGLCFGGEDPWGIRYGRPDETPVAPIFQPLQDLLQYKFRNGQLLLEALTHPSHETHGGLCYQRLEFLGDAVVDLATISQIFKSFPSANSGQLSFMRSRLVCNATLSAIAVKRFSLHKYLLCNSHELSKAIVDEIPYLEESSYCDIIKETWRYDPPKVLGDIFESVIGAIFVDSGYDFQLATRVVLLAMEDAFPSIYPDMPRGPVSQLVSWVAKRGCKKARFIKLQSDELIKRNDAAKLLVHDVVVAGPIRAASLAIAKGAVADSALALLSDESSDLSLTKLCTCMTDREDEAEDCSPREDREKELDNETVDGFAALGELRLDEVVREANFATATQIDEDEEDDRDMLEVEALV